MSEEKVVDKTVPGEKWKFDADVTAAFDDMLQRSIPEYEEMRRLCLDLGSRFVQPKTAVVDLGCSRGEALASFVDRFGAYNQYVGVEVSKPMLEVARSRFRGYVDVGIVDVKELDLRRDYPKVNASLTLCVLTLQFTPIEHRQRLMKDVWRSTVKGGALILVEKVLGACSLTDELFNKAYWSMKEANGYGKDEIERKRLSLEGVLVPVAARWNEDLMSAAGFGSVECFWRNLNFAGWIAVKE